MISKKFRNVSIAGLVAFFSGPLIFTNLYVEHQYYFYANSFYLLMVVSLGTIELYQRDPKKVFLLLMLMLAVRFDAYSHGYKNKIDVQDASVLNPVFESIQMHTQKNQVIMVFGEGWSSVVPYYSQRKAMMVGQGMIHETNFKQALENMGLENLGAIVSCPRNLNESDAKAAIQFIQDHHFTDMQGPFEPSKCTVFLKKM
ncbi:MAG: hypothetical protein R2877_05430 [Bdellovibrionota bacterium]